MKTKVTKERRGDNIVNRLVYIDTNKNLSYVEKRRELGELATKELGITCWG